MVGHQTISEQIDRHPRPRVDHRLHEGVVITSLVENGLAPVASIQGVLPHTTDGRACISWHAVTVSYENTLASIKRYVPLFPPRANRAISSTHRVFMRRSIIERHVPHFSLASLHASVNN